MANQSIQDVLSVSMERLKQLVDVNTIIGDPITVGENTIIIPISKVSFGFASGGSDFPSSQKELFGGGSGGGATIQPLGFIVVANGDVKLLQFATSNNTADKVVNLVPELIDKVSAMFPKKKEEAPKADAE